jgi:hypothetical protein
VTLAGLILKGTAAKASFKT